MNSFKNQKCYARSLKNCSPTISREHYISQGILERISDGNIIGVSGIPGIPAGQMKQIGVESLAAKVLCEKHNSELSSLDNTGIKFFDTLDEINREISDLGQSGVGCDKTICGLDMERWMLKVTLGSVAARIAHRGELTGTMLTMDYWVSVLFGLESMPQGCGLYLVRDPKILIKIEQSIEFAARVNDGKTTTGPIGEVFGLNIAVNGLPFFCNLADPDGNQSQLTFPNLVYRPAGIAFDNGRVPRTMQFNWNDDQPHEQLTLKYLSSNTDQVI